jgi:hypothetical protein
MTVALTTAQLFQPAPSGVGPFGNVPTAPEAGSWLAQMLAVATTVQLPTTSWQSGAPERTIFAVEAVCFSLSDVNISLMAQGGFLQPAAFGSVTYTAVDGTTVTILVTPDPSNLAANPTGALGWLDLLAENVYVTERLIATYATGPLAIAKTTSGSLGPYAAGSYHVASVLGPTYANVDALTIPSSIIAASGGVITAVSSSLSSTIITTSAAHGLATGDSVYVVIPTTSGITGLPGTFALVTAATSTTFQISVGSSGTYTGTGGNVYKCTVANFRADVAGTGSSAGPGQVTTAVTQNVGVYVSNIAGWSGANAESNASLVSRCQLSLAARSPNGPGQAYTYFAESAAQLLAEATPPYVLTNGPVIAETFSTPATGVVHVVVASATPLATTLGANVTPGVSQLRVANISNANPAVVTCVAPTTLAPGQSMTVTITGAEGIAGVNGTFTGTYTAANAFSIPVDTTAAGTYTGGASVEGGDLGQIDALLQTNVVPDGVTAITTSAVALPITVVATVVVPQAYVVAYQLAVVTQLQAQIASYAIGGNEPSHEVGYDEIVGALEIAGVQVLGQASVVREVQSLSLNGLATGVGVAFPGPFYQAILVTPAISVVGV